ncbi:MAG: heavy-metal-associated domain-containing protein [Mariprofundaceae bacterium]|nr:heavy-metal-associated domain-containing protein [Mariprofundaceae bacterium]
MEMNVLMERCFFVDKIQCQGCESTIEQHLTNCPGVSEVKVIAGSGKVIVRYNPLRVRFEALPKIIEQAGFPRFFQFSEEHHQDYLWQQEEDVVIQKALNSEDKT